MHGQPPALQTRKLFQDISRFRAIRIVDVDRSVEDGAVTCNDEAGRERQGPGVVAVVALKVNAEGQVNFAQVVRQGEHQAEFGGQLIVQVREDRNGQGEFFCQLTGKFGS